MDIEIVAGGAMNTAHTEAPGIRKIICDIEEVVESANLLAMELTISALENEVMSDSLAGSLPTLRTVAKRAMIATEEIERLVRGLREK
jgi:hypothetical protein